MNFQMLQNENLMAEIKNKKDTFFSLAIFVIFILVAWYYLFSMAVGEQDMSDYADISMNPYEKYERMMSGEGIRGLVENEQFMEFKYNDKLDDLIQKSTSNERGNPFDETF